MYYHKVQRATLLRSTSVNIFIVSLHNIDTLHFQELLPTVLIVLFHSFVSFLSHCLRRKRIFTDVYPSTWKNVDSNLRGFYEIAVVTLYSDSTVRTDFIKITHLTSFLLRIGLRCYWRLAGVEKNSYVCSFIYIVILIIVFLVIWNSTTNSISRTFFNSSCYFEYNLVCQDFFFSRYVVLKYNRLSSSDIEQYRQVDQLF